MAANPGTNQPNPACPPVSFFDYITTVLRVTQLDSRTLGNVLSSPLQNLCFDYRYLYLLQPRTAV